MPQLILNIGMQASLALPIVINGFHVCRIGLPGTERSTSQAYFSCPENIIIRCTKRLAALQIRIDYPQRAG
ncbi:hypothetical protein J27TS7_46730 [Paenibacillus dendritiformis]|uniref:hypothetical protein n=1 Tax=Paenibacillus dendritiformis TaxID=130049 RepID=UPI001B1DA62C|nr:hypothetical protein [Paenibacillus dendritiformis]GIO75159.1 hypothetical protein J27TS7_46730 [Paenibacillus dendritiformis]